MMQNGQEPFIRSTEVWRKLQYHFSEQEGLLNLLLHNHQISQEALQDVKDALTLVHNDWEKQQTIPRQQVLLLWQVKLQLEQALNNKAISEKEERHSLILQLRNWLDIVFDDPQSSMGEEQALAVLLQHLLGGPSFGLELHQGRVNANFFRQLVLQYEKLKEVWEGKQEVSRRACEAMFSLEDLPWSSDMFSQNEQQELAAMKQVLYKQINMCLQG